ncbi:hypothetical protein IMSHALPRED_003501 [Imshaugia aleurites]|uniref:Cytochrome P450 n=1 Tax=Imshaugia aleurites TaxID=172621 RepID=A0A8H3F7X4_9LECA|nr:hypothetical protein IMSHALPRED_003501 [Imshaugia aleurites]
MYPLVASLAAIIALLFFQGQRSAIRRNGKRLPRPPGTLPLAGNGIWFLQPRHKLLDWFVHCERLVGFSTFEISVPSLPPGIVINDPANVEHVLKNNDIFIKGEFFRIRSWDLFGSGIINADGELWKTQRKAGLRFFSNANLKTFIEDVLPPILADTEESLDDASRRGNVIDLQTVLLDLTTRLMGNMAYDMDMPASLPFSKSFDFASGATGERFQNPFWKLKEFLLGASLRRAVLDVKTFGNRIVFEASQKREDKGGMSKKDTVENSDLLQNNLINSLLDHIDDQQVVADAAMNYLSAGIDTTAQSLTWTLYLLMRHPDAQEKILSELRSTFVGAEDELSLSFDTVQTSYLPYTAAVFNESLRFYPPVPIELKESTVETTFPDGTWLPKGSVVMWATWAMGRSKTTWGDDADEFRPERWLVAGDEGEPLTVKTMSAFAFPVFNGGPRACLGKKMAELLGVRVLASLIWKYDFAEVYDKETTPGETPKERRSQNSLTLPMEGGLPCYIRRRDSRARESL